MRGVCTGGGIIYQHAGEYARCRTPAIPYYYWRMEQEERTRAERGGGKLYQQQGSAALNAMRTAVECCCGTGGCYQSPCPYTVAYSL
jgi:hypothetical protein